MGPIVVKFGGSSLATAGQFEKVADIIHKNPARRYVVASAPGKRCPEDTKVTDLLYRCYDAASAGKDFMPALAQIQQRFEYIIAQLQLQIDLSADLETIAAHLSTAPQRDYMASRGEYLNGKDKTTMAIICFLQHRSFCFAQTGCWMSNLPTKPLAIHFKT